MGRRWVIRGFFLGVFAACIVAWVGSYWRAFSITCWHRDSLFGGRSAIGQEIAAIDNGRIAIGWSDWSWDLAMGFERTYQWRESGFMGFYIYGHGIIFPLWFLIFCSALVLWYAWRKTKSVTKGMAFPVEATTARK